MTHRPVLVAPNTKGWVCPTCRREVRTYCLTCVQCGQEKYPTLSAKPARYICQLCLSGSASRRKIAGRKGGQVASARRGATISPHPD